MRVVVETGQADPAQTGVATPGEGTLVNSGPLDGLTKADAIATIIEILAERGLGQAAVNYRLRDWLLSRQRFWGTPIPIVHCPSCGEVPVPDDQLPVVLPDLRGQDLVPQRRVAAGRGDRLGERAVPEVRRARPSGTPTRWTRSSTRPGTCSGTARPTYEDGPFDPAEVRRWMPVDMYVGGVEHAILHLLYSRFFTKVLYDMGMCDFTEPFTRLINQGQVINEGKAMSKSLGNGVDLGQQIERFGVDAIRLTMIFASPPEDDIDWADMNPDAMVKFLGRIYRIATDVADAARAAGVPGFGGPRGRGGDIDLRKVTHRTIDEVTRQVEAYQLNVAVARLMELVSATRKAIDSGPGAADPAVREAAEAITVLVSLFAPYTAEECWELLGHKPSVARATWPVADQALLTQEKVTCVVQVNGKVRDKLEVPPQHRGGRTARAGAGRARGDPHAG